MRSFLILTSDDVPMRYIVISQSISVDLVPYSIRTNVFLFKIIHVAKIAPFPFYNLAAQGILHRLIA